MKTVLNVLRDRIEGHLAAQCDAVTHGRAVDIGAYKEHVGCIKAFRLALLEINELEKAQNGDDQDE